MKILRYLLYFFASVAAIIITMGLFAKKNYAIERSIDIKAPRDTVFEQIKYFKNFRKWSPWSEIDSDMKVTIEGTDGAPGAKLHWDGNKDVGKGFIELKNITETGVETEITRLKPWQNVTPAPFIITGDTLMTKVTWKFNMYIGFPWNGLAMFTDVNRSVGKDFERGLGNLKKLAEKLARKKYRGFDVLEVDFKDRFFVGTRRLVDSFAVDSFLAVYLPKALAAAKKADVDLSGLPSGLFFTWEKGKTDMAAVMPIAEKIKLKAADSLELLTLPAGPAVYIEYFGDPAGTMEAHLAMDEYFKDKKLEYQPPVIEEYITDRAIEKDTLKWMTKIFYHLKPKMEKDSLPKK